MIIIICMFLFVIIGFILLYLTELIPLFQLLQMEWIAGILMVIPPIITAIMLGSTKTLKLFESSVPGKEIIIFLRRDGTVEPMYATRPFHGESFLEAPKIGLIHDLGKGSVYRWGKKNIRFVLENVNHTPDPRFVNFTKWLYDVGFDNTTEVVNAINGDNGKKIIEELPVATFDPIESSIEQLVDDALNKEDKHEPKWSFKRKN